MPGRSSRSAGHRTIHGAAHKPGSAGNAPADGLLGTTAATPQLHHLRCATTCENAASHSGECKIHGKDVLQRSEAWPNAAHVVLSGLAKAGPLANLSGGCRYWGHG
jgi:hypothetical protein